MDKLLLKTVNFELMVSCLVLILSTFILRVNSEIVCTYGAQQTDKSFSPVANVPIDRQKFVTGEEDCKNFCDTFSDCVGISISASICKAPNSLPEIIPNIGSVVFIRTCEDTTAGETGDPHVKSWNNSHIDIPFPCVHKVGSVTLKTENKAEFAGLSSVQVDIFATGESKLFYGRYYVGGAKINVIVTNDNGQSSEASFVVQSNVIKSSGDGQNPWKISGDTNVQGLVKASYDVLLKMAVFEVKGSSLNVKFIPSGIPHQKFSGIELKVNPLDVDLSEDAANVFPNTLISSINDPLTFAQHVQNLNVPEHLCPGVYAALVQNVQDQSLSEIPSQCSSVLNTASNCNNQTIANCAPLMCDHGLGKCLKDPFVVFKACLEIQCSNANKEENCKVFNDLNLKDKCKKNYQSVVNEAFKDC